MTAEEYAEAQQLVGNGTLHARMLPLLRAALERMEARPAPEFFEHKPGGNIWQWRVWTTHPTRPHVLADGWHVFPSKAEAQRAYELVTGGPICVD